jgi:hypothetical protein
VRTVSTVEQIEEEVGAHRAVLFALSVLTIVATISRRERLAHSLPRKPI